MAIIIFLIAAFLIIKMMERSAKEKKYFYNQRLLERHREVMALLEILNKQIESKDAWQRNSSKQCPFCFGEGCPECL